MDPQHPHTSDWSDADVEELVALAHRLDADPFDLAGCWMSESGLSAAARNPRDEARPAVAVGLIQWTRAGSPGLQLETIRGMTIRSQLRLAEIYYAPHRGRLTSPGAVYLVNWLPALAAHGNEPLFVCAAPEGPFAWAYRDNRCIDVDGDGAITVQDLTEKIRRAQTGPRWEEFAARVRAAMAGAPTLPEIREDNRDQLIGDTIPAPAPLVVPDTLDAGGAGATDHEPDGAT